MVEHRPSMCKTLVLSMVKNNTLESEQPWGQNLPTENGKESWGGGNR